MRPPDEQAGLPFGDERPGTDVAQRTNNPQDDTKRPRKSSTQRDKVLEWLIHQEAVCSTTFLARYVPRAAAHVHALRKLGHAITTRPCSRPDHHHETHQIEYVYEAVPYELWGAS